MPNFTSTYPDGDSSNGYQCQVCLCCGTVLEPGTSVCPHDGSAGLMMAFPALPLALRARFSELRPAATGKTGWLYTALDAQSGRRGVLKVLNGPAPAAKEERQRLKREFVQQSKLNATQLGVPFASGESNRSLWFFRPWFEGSSVRAALKKHGPMSLTRSLWIAAEVASGLRAVHAVGLLGRDLKSGHILISSALVDRPQVHLIDIGVAAPVESHDVSSSGTPEYLAPEQIQGKLPSFRSDLYALGCLLYELLTGAPPFSGEADEVLFEHVNVEAHPLPDTVPSRVARLIEALLSKDPAKRPPSAMQAYCDLRAELGDPAALDASSAVARPANPSAKSAKPLGAMKIPMPPGPKPTGEGANAKVVVPPPPPGQALNAKSVPNSDVQDLMSDELELLDSGNTDELSPLDLELAEEPATPPSNLPATVRKELNLPTPLEAEEVSGAASKTAPVRAAAGVVIGRVRSAAAKAAPTQSTMPSSSSAADSGGSDAAANDLDSQDTAKYRASTPDPIAAPAGSFEAADTGRFGPGDAPSEEDAISTPAIVNEEKSNVVPMALAAVGVMGFLVIGLSLVGALWWFGSDEDERVAEVNDVSPPSSASAPAPEPVQASDPERTQPASTVEAPVPAAVPATEVESANSDSLDTHAESAETGGAEGETAVASDALETTDEAPLDETVVAEAESSTAQSSASEPAEARTAAEDAVEVQPAAEEEAPAARRAPRLSPAERRERFQRARSEALGHFRARRFREAANAYRRATRFNPRHAGSFAGLGASELALGRHRRAVAAYRRAVAISPRSAGFHAALGQALIASGQRRQARASLQRALRLNPNHRAARAAMARLGG